MDILSGFHVFMTLGTHNDDFEVIGSSPQLLEHDIGGRGVWEAKLKDP